MQASPKNRILLWLAAIIVFVGLFALILQPQSLSVTILDPKFRLLDAKISHGTTHELAKANWPITQLSKLLRRAGVNAVVPIQLPPTPEASYALVIRFIGDFAPNELSGMKAELVDASGNATPLRSQAAYVSQRSQDEYGRIWLLPSPPTNAVSIRLSPGIDLAPLAEIRVRGL